jgi:hypothetical protein
MTAISNKSRVKEVGATPQTTTTTTKATARPSVPNKRKRPAERQANQPDLFSCGAGASKWHKPNSPIDADSATSPTAGSAGAASAPATTVVVNTRADIQSVQVETENISECMRRHGIMVKAVNDASLVEDKPDVRHKMLRALTEEFAAANRPLMEVGVYQKELAATLDFAAGGDPRAVAAENLFTITPAQKLKYMTEADLTKGQRPCRAGAKCDTHRIATDIGMKGWTMREFLMPDEETTFESTGELPMQTQLCVFCRQKNPIMHFTTLLYLNKDAQIVIQPYQDLCGVLGGFKEEMCIQPRTDRFLGIVAPFALHNTAMYTMGEDPETGIPFAAFTDAVYFRPAPVTPE